MKTALYVWLIVICLKWCTNKLATMEERQVAITTVDMFESIMEQLGINCPEVVMAQIVLETNYLTSKIFLDNHNLFGMKESSRDYDIGSQHGHALYPNTNASLLDYRAWQKIMGGHKCKTNEEYLYFLDHLPGGRRYAEDPLYTQKLKKIIIILQNLDQ